MMPRSTIRDLLLLTLFCWAIYLPGLTTHGLTNWQEAQRAIVAREMQSRGEWLLPTVDGRPYLAKPPMVYWWQLAIAAVRGGQTGEFELRLTVALAGWLGVLATYAAARRLLTGMPGIDPRLGAWWAGLFLATGFLYVRSSRIGELDILLVPFTVAAVAGIFEAWRCAREPGRAAYGALVLATLAAIGAALTKGPPAVLVIGIAGYGAVALWHANRRGAPPPARAAGAALGGAAAITATLLLTPPESIDEALGLAIFGAMGALAGGALAGLVRPARAWSCLVDFSRTHPLAVLGLPLAAYFAWLWAATRRVGAEVAAASFEAEAQDNLHLLDPGSPLNNLEAAAYGAGLGSFAAAAALVWLVRRRAAPPPALWVPLAWTVGGVVAFSMLGKGVPRYLTPVWPGMAILGATWFADMLPRLPRRRWMAAGAGALVLVMAAGQLYWYGWGRERSSPQRSPRAFISELLARPGVSVEHLALFEFETAAVDFYAGRPIPALADAVPRPGLVGVGPRTIADLRRDLARTGSEAVLLIRRTQPSSMVQRPAAERIEEAGFELEEIPMAAGFIIDNKRTEVSAVRVRPR